MPKAMTEDERARMRAARDAGMTLEAIAGEFQRDRQSVRKALADGPRPTGRRVTEADRAVIEAGLRRGATIQAIERESGFSRATVRAVARDIGCLGAPPPTQPVPPAPKRGGPSTGDLSPHRARLVRWCREKADEAGGDGDAARRQSWRAMAWLSATLDRAFDGGDETTFFVSRRNTDPCPVGARFPTAVPAGVYASALGGL